MIPEGQIVQRHIGGVYGRGGGMRRGACVDGDRLRVIQEPLLLPYGSRYSEGHEHAEGYCENQDSNEDGQKYSNEPSTVFKRGRRRCVDGRCGRRCEPHGRSSGSVTASQLEGRVVATEVVVRAHTGTTSAQRHVVADFCGVPPTLERDDATGRWWAREDPKHADVRSLGALTADKLDRLTQTAGETNTLERGSEGEESVEGGGAADDEGFELGQPRQRTGLQGQRGSPSVEGFEVGQSGEREGVQEFGLQRQVQLQLDDTSTDLQFAQTIGLDGHAQKPGRLAYRRHAVRLADSHHVSQPVTQHRPKHQPRQVLLLGGATQRQQTSRLPVATMTCLLVLLLVPRRSNHQA